MVIINVDEEPTKRVHVAWMVKRDFSDPRILILQELVEYYYPHPDAPGLCLVQNLVVENVKRLPETDAETSIWKIMLWSEESLNFNKTLQN